jgi:hypothetical protein
VKPVLFERVMEVHNTSRQAKFFKILRIEMKNYSHHNDNGSVLNQPSMDINLFNTNLSDKILISVLLIETKRFGGIWSFGEHSMGIYMGGRQIYESPQEVHKRGE